MFQDDDDRNVLVSVLAGIGIGVLVGAVAGLLMAPKTGEETRDNLGKSMTDLGDKMTEMGRDVVSKVQHATERLRAQAVQKLGEAPSDNEESLG
ncbi:MAG: YtxH domain-containing protein [Chthonomonadaceae bacterium]|nr:YtxH domain-containing protein [Chthonomonadaceae bacterium]